MAKIPHRIKKIIDKYIEALRINNVPISQIVLFGSYARGTFQKWSDIDIALVSDIFEGDRFLDRGKIRRINLSVSSDLEILPYHPQDFTINDPFVKEIIETGVKIL